MNWTYPSAWQFTILALAVAYGFYLVSESVLLERPRDWLLLRIKDEQLGEKAEAFVECPWCVGFWIGLLVTVGWLLFPTTTLVVCTPFALAAVSGLIHHFKEAT